MCPAIPAVRSPLLVDACCEAFNFVHATSSTRIRAATSKEIWPFEDEKLLKEMLTSITEKFHAAEETQTSFQKSH